MKQALEKFREEHCLKCHKDCLTKAEVRKCMKAFKDFKKDYEEDKE